MEVLSFVITIVVYTAAIISAGVIGVYLYRLGLRDNEKGNVQSSILPQIPKKPYISKEQMKKIEEEKAMRREGFNNIMKYMNGEEQ